MTTTGKDLALDKMGFTDIGQVLRNLPVEDIIENIVDHQEGTLGLNGAVMVDTGRYTGRSPKDKYFVDEGSSNKNLWWGPVNAKIDESIFDDLYEQVVDYYNHSDDSNTYVFDGFAGADPTYRLNVRIIAKKAWQAHFAHNMFIRPENGELDGFNPDFTIITASDVYNEKFEEYGMQSKTFIIFHMAKWIAIIGGTQYDGEMKKGIFSVMN